jgi:hypothetical protein
LIVQTATSTGTGAQDRTVAGWQPGHTRQNAQQTFKRDCSTAGMGVMPRITPLIPRLLEMAGDALCQLLLCFAGQDIQFKSVRDVNKQLLRLSRAVADLNRPESQAGDDFVDHLLLCRSRTIHAAGLEGLGSEDTEPILG